MARRQRARRIRGQGRAEPSGRSAWGRLECYESVALYLSADGKPPEASVGTLAARAAKGTKPSGEIVQVADASATVQSIGAAKRELMLKGPQ